MVQKKLLFVYDYFFPGYKAGGPIQSLTNLVLMQQANNQVFVVTGGYDLQSNEAYTDVKLNAWNRKQLPGAAVESDIWYADLNGPSKKTWLRLINQIDPDYIYLNGVFSVTYFIRPLLAAKSMGYDNRIVICPRGMLQKGALGGKSFKKKLYLKLLRLWGLVKQAKWHATNAEEEEDIRISFPYAGQIVIAENIPRKPLSSIVFPYKKRGELHLVYLSLIAEKKNLHLLLNAVGKIGSEVTLLVYGPPKDVGYWHQCEEIINTMPHKVTYMGDIRPENVQQAIAAAHVFILPTKGENFGHALYESLSVGRPIITSFFTPWNNLDEQKAGKNIDIVNEEGCLNAIKEFMEMEQNTYSQYCSGAYQMARNYYEKMDASAKYEKLFE